MSRAAQTSRPKTYANVLDMLIVEGSSTSAIPAEATAPGQIRQVDSRLDFQPHYFTGRRDYYCDTKASCIFQLFLYMVDCYVSENSL